MLESDIKELLDYIISQKTFQKREQTLQFIREDYPEQERRLVLNYVIKKRKQTTTLIEWTVLVQIENRLF